MILDSRHEEYVMNILSGLSHRVILTLHSDRWDSVATKATQDLINYTGSLAPTKISCELAPGGPVSWADPMLTIRNEDDETPFGVQFVGSPSGLEYREFLQTIRLATRQNLSSSMPELPLLSHIQRPVSAQIFVSPT